MNELLLRKTVYLGSFHLPSKTIRSSRDYMLCRAVSTVLEMVRQGVGTSHNKGAFHQGCHKQ